MTTTKRCLYFSEDKKTICGNEANSWITDLLEFPIDDFCPDCLEKLAEAINNRAQEIKQLNKGQLTS